ncbi:hypothetical protein Vafri_16990, partial [Volvox africanus]
MQDGTGVGAIQAAPVSVNRLASNELDVYNARSIKLAEATRVRLFLPGLKGGPQDEWDDPQDAKVAAQAAAQAAATRGPSDTALKSRKKLAKVAALAHANEPAAVAAGPAVAEVPSGVGASGAEGGLMMVVEAIMVLEDDEDDEGLLFLAPNGSGAGPGPGPGGSSISGSEGGFGTGSGALGSGQQRLSQGYDSERGAVHAGYGGRYYTTPGINGTVSAGASGTSASTGGVLRRD